jgi:hypothetical protein
MCLVQISQPLSIQAEVSSLSPTLSARRLLAFRVPQFFVRSVCLWAIVILKYKNTLP